MLRGCLDVWWVGTERGGDWRTDILVELDDGMMGLLFTWSWSILVKGDLSVDTTSHFDIFNYIPIARWRLLSL